MYTTTYPRSLLSPAHTSAHTLAQIYSILSHITFRRQPSEVMLLTVTKIKVKTREKKRGDWSAIKVQFKHERTCKLHHLNRKQRNHKHYML